MIQGVSVVIPSWNTRELLRAALQALYAGSLLPEETIVIDNASGDDSAAMVAADFPQVRLLRNAKNEGFARACNQGLELARGAYLLLLNADTELAPDALERLLRCLEQNPRLGAVAPKLVHPDGRIQPTCMRFPRWATPLFFGTPLERWWPDSPELRRYFYKDFDHLSSRDVDQPPAACLLVRREALDQTGFFDEQFWLFYNDVDLSLRMQRLGWKTHYLAEAVVLHHVGASTRQFSNFLGEWHKNRLAYFRKHHGWLAGLWVKACASWAFLDWIGAQCWRALRGQTHAPLRPMLRAFGVYLVQ